MSTAQDHRWAHVTYASFGSRTRRSGWNVGPSLNASDRDRSEVESAAPTSLVPVNSVDDFISSSAIDALPRRFEYRPLEGFSLYLQSVPAGKDSTGRPGNVFTHAFIDHEPEKGIKARYPIDFYRSPDLLTPFRANAVNAAELDGDLGEPEVGPMADLPLAWMMVDDMFGERREALYQLQDILQVGEKVAVLLLKNSNEAAYWMEALSSTLTPEEARLLLHFSTFERAATAPTWDSAARGATVVVCPPEDRALLDELPGVHVIDPEHTVEREHLSWARMTAGIFDGGFNADELVEELVEVNFGVSYSAPGSVRVGGGLARLIKNRGDAVTQDLFDIAEEHLPGDFDRVEILPSGLDLVEEVVENPRLALPERSWRYLDPAEHGDDVLEDLVTRATEHMQALADAPVRELLAYVNVLLHTGLIEADPAADEPFLRELSGFPALDSWEQAAPLADVHPGLGFVVRAALRQRRRETAPTLEDFDSAVRQLDRNTPLISVYAWLEIPGNVTVLKHLVQRRFLEESRYNYALSALRLYYSVALRLIFHPFSPDGTPLDKAIVNLITDMCTQTVTRYAHEERSRTGNLIVDPLIELGRKIGSRELHSIDLGAQQRRYLDEIKRNAVPGYRGTHPEANEVFVIVAREIMEEDARLRSRDRNYRKGFRS